MAYPIDWQQWASAVLSAVGPESEQNYATLWAWSLHESGADIMRWNNPLNTTQWEIGCQSMNSVGVKSYPSIAVGAMATVQTLKNGFYPHILAALAESAPPSVWQQTCAPDLNTWGSGTAWLASVPVTSNSPTQNGQPIGDDDMALALLIRDGASGVDPHGQGAVYLAQGAKAPDGTFIPVSKRHIAAPADLNDYTAHGMAVETVPGYLLDRAEDGPDIASGSYPAES